MESIWLVENRLDTDEPILSFWLREQASERRFHVPGKCLLVQKTYILSFHRAYYDRETCFFFFEITVKHACWRQLAAEMDQRWWSVVNYMSLPRESNTPLYLIVASLMESDPVSDILTPILFSTIIQYGVPAWYSTLQQKLIKGNGI